MSTTELETKLVLGPRLAGTAMTPEEFDAVEEYDEHYCYELISGVLIATPIPLAEETGLIVPIGLWVLHSACVRLKAWSVDPARRGLKLAVNISPRQFRQSNFVSQVMEVLAQTGAAPSRLKLELTEGLVLDNVEDTIEKMHALRALGIEFSMDDFGTGYSSLSYLKRLPLSELKIDRSFVQDLSTDSNDATIVRTIITGSVDGFDEFI